jgi:plasmid maintenance system antidote protein VapI
MDNMLEHPWTQLQLLIKEKWLTQKAFASILWKKVSEVNELLKWKRNITIQRDYLLHQTLWTPIKYWILKQIDYDYSLIDIDKGDINNNPGSISMTDQDWNREQNENGIEPGLNWVKDTQETPIKEPDPKDDEDYQNRVKIFKSF